MTSDRHIDRPSLHARGVAAWHLRHADAPGLYAFLTGAPGTLPALCLEGHAAGELRTLAALGVLVDAVITTATDARPLDPGYGPFPMDVAQDRYAKTVRNALVELSDLIHEVRQGTSLHGLEQDTDTYAPPPSCGHQHDLVEIGRAHV